MQAAGLGNGGPPQSPQAPDRRSCLPRRGRMAPSGGSLTALARPGTVRKPSWLPGLFPDLPSIAVDGPVISVFDRADRYRGRGDRSPSSSRRCPLRPSHGRAAVHKGGLPVSCRQGAPALSPAGWGSTRRRAAAPGPRAVRASVAREMTQPSNLTPRRLQNGGPGTAAGEELALLGQLHAPDGSKGYGRPAWADEPRGGRR